MQLDSESNLYASVGERGQGNIAQNFTEHPAVLLRLNWMDRYLKIILNL